MAFVLVWQHYFKLLLLIAVSTGLSSVAAFCVYDITRSGSYAFPVLFIALVLLEKTCEQLEVRKSLMIAFVVSAVSSPIFMIAEPLEGWWTLRPVMLQDRSFYLTLYDFVYYFLW